MCILRRLDYMGKSIKQAHHSKSQEFSNIKNHSENLNDEID